MAETNIDLSISPETAFYILEKAREYEEKVAPTDPDPGSNPADDRGVDVLEDLADDPTLAELVAAVRALNDDQQADLIALLWLGRGDFSVEEWTESRRLARERRVTPVARYVAGTPLASDYIEEGLSQLGYDLSGAETGRRF